MAQILEQGQLHISTDDTSGETTIKAVGYHVQGEGAEKMMLQHVRHLLMNVATRLRSVDLSESTIEP